MAEPKFRNIDEDDLAIRLAHTMAAETVSKFRTLVEQKTDAQKMAKLRFRRPDLSDQVDEDRFLYLWLSEVVYDLEKGTYSGMFFEVPQELLQWHHVGQRLEFEADEIFDWTVNDNGRLRGGFTMRVTRNRLNGDDEKAKYDEYIGVSTYEPLEM